MTPPPRPIPVLFRFSPDRPLSFQYLSALVRASRFAFLQQTTGVHFFFNCCAHLFREPMTVFIDPLQLLSLVCSVRVVFRASRLPRSRLSRACGTLPRRRGRGLRITPYAHKSFGDGWTFKRIRLYSFRFQLLDELDGGGFEFPCVRGVECKPEQLQAFIGKSHGLVVAKIKCGHPMSIHGLSRNGMEPSQRPLVSCISRVPGSACYCLAHDTRRIYLNMLRGHSSCSLLANRILVTILHEVAGALGTDGESNPVL